MFKHAKPSVLTTIYLVMAGICIISIVLATNIGAVSVSPSTVFKIIANSMSNGKFFPEGGWTAAQQSIIWNLRFPKVLVTVCTGAGLALSGIFMQVLTKNPLADPFILGISSGAATGAVTSILIGSLPIIGAFSVQAGAFAGSLISILLVLLIVGKSWSNGTTKLVLVGMAVSALFSALTNFIIFVTPDNKKVNNALFWMTGSFSGTGWDDLPLAFICVLIGIVVVVFISHYLDAMLLGENFAKLRGVDTKKVKLTMILVSSFISAVLVSMCGVIGFVGLVIPHVSRLIMGPVHRRMVPFALLLGAIFMVWADAIARVVVIPSEMPVGVITSLVGVPFFLAMIRKSRYGFGE